MRYGTVLEKLAQLRYEMPLKMPECAWSTFSVDTHIAQGSSIRQAAYVINAGHLIEIRGNKLVIFTTSKLVNAETWAQKNNFMNNLVPNE